MDDSFQASNPRHSTTKVINHDIRGALNAVLNLSSLIQDPAFKLTPTEISDYHSKICWSAQHLNHLFLSLSHHHDQGLQSERNPSVRFSEDTLINTFETVMQPYDASHRCQLVNQTIGDTRTIYITDCHLESLIFNLFNALCNKPTSSGHLSIYFNFSDSGLHLIFSTPLSTQSHHLTSVLTKDELVLISPWVLIAYDILSEDTGTIDVQRSTNNEFVIKIFVTNRCKMSCSPA
jgi:hypothetical protein